MEEADTSDELDELSDDELAVLLSDKLTMID
jgi:hypothetical protein